MKTVGMRYQGEELRVGWRHYTCAGGHSSLAPVCHTFVIPSKEQY